MVTVFAVPGSPTINAGRPDPTTLSKRNVYNVESDVGTSVEHIERKRLGHNVLISDEHGLLACFAARHQRRDDTLKNTRIARL